ncbi:transposase [Domibacillus indicus]|uniref:transposase n=1 Tax=Domibacillus indicus TaxID=1437523 RepID=UPI00203F18C5|nr:transposase [Domibacillus indicus]MCM3791629.1 transposase [Domibacillus indicus]
MLFQSFFFLERSNAKMTRLVHENQVIAVENLSVKNLVQSKKRSKGIHDASWSRFNEMLSYKAKWYGRTIIKVDPFFPSSQLCSGCGSVRPAACVTTGT